MSHPIEPHAGGKLNLSRAQQRWAATDDSKLLHSAAFAGHEMLAVTDDKGGFDLLYLGFHATGYASLDEAQRAAPDVARRILQRMHDLIAD